jgi:hypothetical protein
MDSNIKVYHGEWSSEDEIHIRQGWWKPCLNCHCITQRQGRLLFRGKIRNIYICMRCFQKQLLPKIIPIE